MANQNSNNVTKLNAATGATLGTYGAGKAPAGLAYDGASVWVTNSQSDNVTKLRASTGANLGTFPVGDNPLGVTTGERLGLGR